jgi:hypothetical protein
MREYLQSTLGIDSGNWGEPLVVDVPSTGLASDSLRLISVIVPAPARSEAVPTVQLSPDNR